MPQFDIHKYEIEPVSFLMDIQSDLLDGLPTRVVVPLVPPEEGNPPIKTLHPIVYVQGRAFVALVHLMAAISARSLGEIVDTARYQRDEIVRALDFLVTG